MGECLKFGSLNAIEERQERLRKDRITGPKYSSVLKPLEKKLTRDWKARNVSVEPFDFVLSFKVKLYLF